jgi:DNA-binding CsgD family transcriptional regulator
MDSATMIPIALAVYYALSYSIGVSSLVYAVVLRFQSKDNLLGLFIANTAVLTAIVASSSINNAFGEDLGSVFRTALRWINYSSAAIFSYLVVAFAVEAYPFRGGRAVKAAALVISAACLALVMISSFILPSRWMDIAVLLAKDAAILAAAAIALNPGGKKAKGPYQSFLRAVSITALVLFPAIVWDDLGAILGGRLFGLRGPVTLPGLYGLWSAFFFASRIKGGVHAGIRVTTIDPAFLSRFGVSPREADVLKLLVEGKSYKEIMSALFISMPTVKSHVVSLYKKTGTVNRIDLARKLAG